jgi:hypothetical protein
MASKVTRVILFEISKKESQKGGEKEKGKIGKGRKRGKKRKKGKR